MQYKLDKPLGSTKSSFINILSASAPQNVDFAHYVPMEIRHDIAHISVVPLKFNLLWANFTMVFMSKFNILLS